MPIQQIVLVILSDQLICQYGHFWLPSVIAMWIALPFDQVLELSAFSLEPVIDNGLDFVLFFVSDQVGWRSEKVGAVCRSFAIGR
jgi:hypothetical protein